MGTAALLFGRQSSMDKAQARVHTVWTEGQDQGPWRKEGKEEKRRERREKKGKKRKEGEEEKRRKQRKKQTAGHRRMKMFMNHAPATGSNIALLPTRLTEGAVGRPKATGGREVDLSPQFRKEPSELPRQMGEEIVRSRHASAAGGIIHIARVVSAVSQGAPCDVVQWLVCKASTYSCTSLRSNGLISAEGPPMVHHCSTEVW